MILWAFPTNGEKVSVYDQFGQRFVGNKGEERNSGNFLAPHHFYFKVCRPVTNKIINLKESMVIIQTLHDS